MLNLKQIKKDYKTASETVHALKDVSIVFRKSEFVSVLGPSGCGKTTLLNIVGGLDHYTDGDLVINGKSTKAYTDRDWDVYRNHRVGFIFQSYNLIPHQTVLGNVELALTIAGIEREERIERAKRALDRVGLSDKYYVRPNQLSGGQCQRVAIARALVNDPEILLADEPTGALDTVTSVQIMDLIKEISNERLVIMVTHNPELAEQYSSRIIKLLDGNVIEDSNPYSEEEEQEELARLSEQRLSDSEEDAAGSDVNEIADEQEGEAAKELDTYASEQTNTAKRKTKRATRAKKEKAKMSFFTAFMLSARNLLSKKGRTAMVGFAGSIGIIGIAMVLAFSAGIKGYVDSMQDDMLSGNPVQITKTALDLSALTGMMNEDTLDLIEKLPGKVYISSLVEYLVKTSDSLNSMMVTNDLTEDYINYVKNMPKDYYNAMLLEYGINMIPSIFVDFKTTPGAEPQHISIRYITDIYKSVLKETEYAQMSGMVDMLAPSLQQAPNEPDYILSQYDLVGDSKIATEKNEVMLVLNSEDELSDLLLARLGYYSQAEFLEIINKATSEDGTYNTSLYREYFTYEELLDKTLTWYPTDTLFSADSFTIPNPAEPGETITRIEPHYTSKFDTPHSSGLKLKVVGILTPKDTISYGSLSSGIYYTEALTEYMLEQNANSSFIANYITPDLEVENSYKSVTYTYDYYSSEAFDGANIKADAEPKKVTTPSSVLSGTAESMMRALGGNKLANEVSIYPISFDDKDLVTEYLDLWNKDNVDITVGDKIIPGAERKNVQYTDALELIVSLVNTMIDIVSYALIAFTSISLVVSTVMIGIITYVSVVERIKEIGVIRSLGGRKKDVSHLFNAETFIIGSLAGILGISVTYLISFIVNLILKPLIGYPRIAALPVHQAILLILLSVGLTLISGLIPASSAAKKDPVVALRTE